ncbi:Short chain isoprenyl diphosphate synthase [Hypsizygus marmoreus]|uniref:(2E,6E)-farnesyl diphosphate synthase n=1 Tax=Hypsizygus marmoreus TaxID=39966 RepID=A0A369J559_HYPMA|nr:Short chain isoprenyl diphosphate synthase [Hypsizygus marmoreus]
MLVYLLLARVTQEGPLLLLSAKYGCWSIVITAQENTVSPTFPTCVTWLPLTSNTLQLLWYSVHPNICQIVEPERSPMIAPTTSMVDAAIAHHTDWPAPGTIIQRMSEIDLPRQSSGTEWWYYNFHLSLVDGRKASAFIAFFRTTSLKPMSPATNDDTETSHEVTHTHLLNFAVSILPAPNSNATTPLTNGAHNSADDAAFGRYYSTSAMDVENVKYLASVLEVDTRVDSLIRRSLLDVLRRGQVPEPDIFIQGPISVAEEGDLNLKFGDLGSVVCTTNARGEEVYHIVARAEDGLCGFEIDLIPRKPPINHGANGVVQGDLHTPDDGMYYCFVPRCEVSGSVLIDGKHVDVDSAQSMGWYDREFGGSIRKWYESSTRSDESSWKWGSAQLDNGWDLTFYTLWDVDIYNGDVIIRDKRAIAISPEGSRIECDDHTFEYSETWSSVTTLNEYGTKWKLSIPQPDIDFSIEAPFVKQETRTLCATRGYWEGRVSIKGTMGGKEVTGLGYVESVPAQLITKFENYMKRITRVTADEVKKIYPDNLIDPETAVRVLILDSDASTEPGSLPPVRFTRDVRLDSLYENLFAPVRHLSDRGGKSWRSFLGMTCISALGADPEPFKALAAATELLHTGSLIIDDIQDESPMRRGVKSVHNVWGVATAINAGTAAYFAFDTAMRSMTPYLRPEQTLRIYQIYFETMRAAHVGQALDIAGQQRVDLEDVLSGRVSPSVLEKRVISVHRLKTAIIAANIAKISAVIADASPAQIQAIATYFERVGIAFQIIDDVYDIRGWSHVITLHDKRDKKPTLKRRGDDIRSGKISIPLAKAGSMMPLEEARWVWETVLSKPGDDDELTHRVIDKLEAHGVVDLCVDEAHEMVDGAWTDLEPFLKESHMKVTIRALGWYLVKYNSI